MRSLLISIMLIIATLAPGQGAAQTQASVEEYKFDIGVGLGMSGYLGDANESNLFAHPGVAFNASFRYLINSRWAMTS